MKKKCTLLTLAAILLTMFSFCVQAQVNDPDVPGFIKKINKEEYLRLRAQFYEERTGDASKFSYNPRTKAITETKQKEAQVRANNRSMLVSTPWVQLGPAPIPNGQTEGVMVPVTGRISAIAVHPTNENIVYIGAASGGVYRSMDGGANWTPIFDNAQSLVIGALALAPSNPSILFVGTGEPQLSQDAFAGIGIYRIENADAAPVLVGPINPLITFSTGTTTFTTTAFGFRTVSKIEVHPTNPDTIFVSTATGTSSRPSAGVPGTIPPVGLLGVYRSGNATAPANSVSFTKLTVTTSGSVDVPATGNRRIMDMVMEPGNPNNLLCWVLDVMDNISTTQGGGIYRSTNALAATPIFTKVYNPTLDNVRGEFAIAKVNGNVVAYAGTGENGGNGRILRSVDSGASWISAPGTVGFCAGQCFYDIAMAVDPTNAARVYIGGSSGNNIFRLSMDSVNTVPTPLNATLHADVHSIVVSPSNPNTVYLGCDGGIYRSANGGLNFVSVNTPALSATQFQSIALHPRDPNYTIGGTQDNGTIEFNSARTFRRVDFGDGGYTAIDSNSTDAANSVMYHTYFNNSSLAGYARVNSSAEAFDGNWRFYGCGAESSGVAANGIDCPVRTLFYAPMALGPGRPNPVYFGTDVLYRSADTGVNNTKVSQTFSVAISNIFVSNLDDNYRMIGLNNGAVFATINGSTTLVDITPPGAPARPVGEVRIHPTNKNIAFVTYTGYGVTTHIFKTTNLNDVGGAGVSWTASSNGIPDVPVNCITINRRNPLVMFCGTDVGVFASEDGGANWMPFNINLPVVPVFDIEIQQLTNVIRIATHGRGFWENGAMPLPVTNTEFTVMVKGKTTVLLNWFTASETNNKGFEVQRAVLKDNLIQKWETVGFVKGSGTTNSPRRYEYEDVPVGGRKFVYRLRQLDFDNIPKISEQRQVTLSEYDFVLHPVFPNPVKTNAAVKYHLPVNGKVTIAIYNSSGVLVKTILNQEQEAGIYQTSFATGELSAGAYYVALRSGIYFNTKPFMIQ